MSKTNENQEESETPAVFTDSCPSTCSAEGGYVGYGDCSIAVELSRIVINGCIIVEKSVLDKYGSKAIRELCGSPRAEILALDGSSMDNLTTCQKMRLLFTPNV